jgi:hypothetical protein
MSRYFMRELLPHGAVDEPQLPVFLTSWVDKSSALCMYTMTQSRIWSVPHLKTGCWYLDFPKSFCPVEEEDVKKSCNKADSKGAATMPVNAEEQDVEIEPNLLPEKERLKRERETKKAELKAEKEAEKAKDKLEREAKKARRSGKSKAVASSIPMLVLPEASTGSMSQNPRKRDSSFTQLSVSRLQQCISPAFQDCTGGTLLLDELFLSTSLEATESYYVEHNAFPKEWLEMQAFLEKVFPVSCFPLLHDVTAKVLK